MKLFPSISPKNLHQPYLFGTTSQKIYSFEGFIYYGQNHWMEAAEVLEREDFSNWLGDILGLKEIQGLLYKLQSEESSSYKNLLQFLEFSGLGHPERLAKIEEEMMLWEQQPLEQQNKKRGDQFFKERNFEGALAAYKRAQAISFCPIVEHNIGATYMYLHFFEEAERAFHKSLKHKDSDTTHLNLIRLLKITSRSNEALARIKELLSKTQNAELYYECGSIYQMKEQYEKALECYNSAFEFTQEEAILEKLVEVSIALGDMERVESFLERLRTMNLETYIILKARQRLKNQEIDKALEILEDGFIELGNSKKIALELSRVCRQKKQIIKAINYITKAQNLGADQDEILYEMALIAKRAGIRTDYNSKIEEMVSVWKTSIRQRFTE
ncbi:MAG: hypothetical protein H7X94_07195 [Vallitaleaceae bacterium]|nr:hypothetical protein [Vallitaleaceae bacterium]